MKKRLTLLMMLLSLLNVISYADDNEEVYVNYEGLRFHLYYKNVGIGNSDYGFVYAVYFKLCLPENGVEYSGDITIPQKIPYHFDNGEYGFVYGQEFSFAGNENITSVIYPDAFCPRSFKGCTNLKKVVLPKNLSPHRYFTFNGMPKMFMGCKNLTEVSNVAFLKELGESYFEGCENLHHISLTEKDNYGEEVSISIIDKSAFKDCKSLESLDLSNVTSIGSYAFQGCSSLEEVTFGKNLFINSEGIFSDCMNLKTVSGFENMKNQQYSSRTYRTIPAFTFNNCKSLENISLPSTDDLRIEASAFEGCESLKQIGGDFSVSAASQIKESAFKGCKSLETLPVDWKGGGGFRKEVFSGCHNLSFGDTLKAYSCGNSSFRECYKLKAVEILSDQYYSVEDSAFYDCQNLTSFSSPSGYIRDKVFYNCQNLYHLKCWLYRTGYQSFYNCKKLPSVVFSNKYDDAIIGEQSFYGCSDLERVSFRRLTLGNNAFQECHKLKDVYNAKSLAFTNIDSGTFPYSTYHDGVLHLASNSTFSEYSLQIFYNQGWGLFENKQFDYHEADNNGGVQLIYRQGTYYHVINGAFIGYYDTECIIPKIVNDHYVTRIEPKAFKDNLWVTSIEIPASVQYIDSLAFSNTPSLTSIYVKNRHPI